MKRAPGKTSSPSQFEANILSNDGLNTNKQTNSYKETKVDSLCSISRYNVTCLELGYMLKGPTAANLFTTCFRSTHAATSTPFNAYVNESDCKKRWWMGHIGYLISSFRKDFPQPQLQQTNTQRWPKRMLHRLRHNINGKVTTTDRLCSIRGQNNF